ncbi:hypothetical protein [Bradyrhizobium sp. CCBAU 11357]|uniref:hypothetical protein n=1 Tax=Bradyrhizobium sp. CCBAU 11357 TaxID=1630808 RepID=UPI00230462B9|nr:hypothetical protein [Bradyrhizobium sp. CCBAU 11357]
MPLPNIEQRKFLESLLHVKSKVLWGAEITPDIQELVRWGLVREVSLFHNESGFALSNEGREFIENLIK